MAIVSRTSSREGVKEIVITNRSQERAEKIADIFKDQNVSVRPWAGRHSLVTESDLIVITQPTKVWLDRCAKLDLSIELAQPEAIVADIIYVPTSDARSSKMRNREGCKYTVGGLSGCFYINHDPHGSFGSVSTPR